MKLIFKFYTISFYFPFSQSELNIEHKRIINISKKKNTISESKRR